MKPSIPQLEGASAQQSTASEARIPVAAKEGGEPTKVPMAVSLGIAMETLCEASREGLFDYLFRVAPAGTWQQH